MMRTKRYINLNLNRFSLPLLIINNIIKKNIKTKTNYNYINVNIIILI